MRSRTEILKDLVLLQGNIALLEKELSKFSWDSDLSLCSINSEDFIFVLNRIINDEISLEALINWANALECRDDLAFKNEALQELIFELANPEINGDATKER